MTPATNELTAIRAGVPVEHRRSVEAPGIGATRTGPRVTSTRPQRKRPYLPFDFDEPLAFDLDLPASASLPLPFLESSSLPLPDSSSFEATSGT